VSTILQENGAPRHFDPMNINEFCNSCDVFDLTNKVVDWPGGDDHNTGMISEERSRTQYVRGISAMIRHFSIFSSVFAAVPAPYPIATIVTPT
jgi:hypothetical protein